MNIVSAVILCTIVGAVGAIVLVAAAKFMAVEEDPRIEEVSACLAGANCGGCGYAGCSDYAKAVVLDGVPCDKCAPGGPKAAAAIAKIMGGEASAVEKKAVVQCQGSSEHCKPAYDYKGIQTCAAAAALYGGPKTCSFACIGLGDCTKVCKFDAIHIVDGVAKVDKDKCTGCGACANICPKQVIMIDAAGPRKPVVMCSNKDKGAVANKLCTTSCIACGMCERTCKFDAIHVVDGVARVDYDKCKGCGMCAQKCPKHIILFPLKDDPNPPKPVVKQAPKPAAAPAAPAEPAAKAEEAKAPEAPKAAETPAAPAQEPCQDDNARRITEFLTGLLEHMDSPAQVKVTETEKGRYSVVLEGQKLGQLIGRRGETLDAIQQLTNYAVNSGREKRIRVHVDAENYRAKREQSLESLARKVAGKVTKYRRSVTLEPMNAYERHVIHAALQDVPGVNTYSIGTEPNRRVVVSYDRDKR